MVPLGDKIERKSQILYTTFASVIALIIAATAQSYFVEIASLLIGITSSASTYFAIGSLIERTRRTG
jgi:predicted MFS family arabinose efflux permease